MNHFLNNFKVEMLTKFRLPSQQIRKIEELQLLAKFDSIRLGLNKSRSFMLIITDVLYLRSVSPFFSLSFTLLLLLL